jgi:hypothetical protein
MLVYTPEHVCGAAFLLGWGLLVLVHKLNLVAEKRRKP